MGLVFEACGDASDPGPRATLGVARGSLGLGHAEHLPQLNLAGEEKQKTFDLFHLVCPGMLALAEGGQPFSLAVAVLQGQMGTLN